MAEKVQKQDKKPRKPRPGCGHGCQKTFFYNKKLFSYLKSVFQTTLVFDDAHHVRLIVFFPTSPPVKVMTHLQLGRISICTPPPLGSCTPI